MTAVRSSDGYLGIGKQTSKGTDVAPTKFCRLNAAETIEQIQEVLEVRSLNGDEELDAIYKTAHKPDGSFQTLWRPDLGAAILAYVLGADSVVTGTVHTHTITRADTVPWLSIERGLDNFERIEDAKINQVVISGVAGQPVSLDVSFMGIDSNIGSTATPSYETNEPFMFFDGTYTFDSAGNTNIAAFTITLTRNLEEKFTTSYKRNDLIETAFDVEVTASLVFQASDAIYPKILYGASTALTDVLGTGDLTVSLSYGSGATERQGAIAIPSLVHLSAAKHLDPQTKAVMLDIRSKPIKSGSEIVTVTCKNTTSTAYV